MPGYVELVRRNRRRSYDLRRIAADGGPVCCEVLTNVLYSLSRTAVGKAVADGGAASSAATTRRPACSGRVARPRAPRRFPLTWTALAPLALPDLPESDRPPARRGARARPRPILAARAGARRSTRATPGSTAAMCSVPGIHRYWRGPTWINAAWLVWLGLLRLGYSIRGRDDGEAAVRHGPRARSARVLRPVQRAWHGSGRLRVVGADHGDGDPGPAPPRRATSG